MAGYWKTLSEVTTAKEKKEGWLDWSQPA